MPPAGPQQMSDPGDKSDDLISELAKLMATGPAAKAEVKPMANLQPLPPLTAAAEPAPSPVAPPSAAPSSIRIPGMEASAPAMAAAAPQPATVSMPAAPAEPPRAALTGTLRIPGMDSPPAPVATSAPVAKFDFPKPSEPAPSSPVQVVSAQPRPVAPAPAPEPIPVRSSAPVTPFRVPGLDVKPVSENKSFGDGPAVVRPAAPPASKPPEPAEEGAFKFDFGFGKQPDAKPANDPIAALIAAELEADTKPAFVINTKPESAPAPQPKPEPSPAARNLSSPMPAPVKPNLPPLASTRPAPAPAQSPVPLKPVNAAPRPTESDRFAISPGMGFNGRQGLNPQPLPPAEEPRRGAPADPMQEIEDLIGEAVRVELAPPGPVKVQSTPPLAFRAEPQFQQREPEPTFDPEAELDAEPELDSEPIAPRPQAPVVPPAAQFAPRRSAINDRSGDPAEDAILAASADSGIDIGHLDGPSVTDESPYRRLKVKPQRQTFMSGGMRQYVGMAIAGTLLLAAGLGLYWVLNMGRGGVGENAPVLTADATPVKAAPTPEAPAEDALPASPVMEQLNGPSAEPATELLVPTDETAGQDVARVIGADNGVTPAVTAEDDSEGGLANRKVRTVTVRPDGTIVSGDDSVAGAEELPVDRPNVPELPGVTDDVDLLGDTNTAVATAELPTELPAEPLAAIDTGTAPVTATAALDPAATSPVVSGGVVDPTKVPPTLAGPPNRQAMLAAYQAAAQPAQPEPLAAIDAGTTDLFATDSAPAPVTTTASAGGAYVQLASSPSEADANAQARSMQSRYGSLFGGNSLTVVAADLGQKGVWYRVRLPAGSLSNANAICASIKANGGDCITGG